MLHQSDAARGTTLRACAVTGEAVSVGHAARERGGEELADPCGGESPSYASGKTPSAVPHAAQKTTLTLTLTSTLTLVVD